MKISFFDSISLLFITVACLLISFSWLCSRLFSIRSLSCLAICTTVISYWIYWLTQTATYPVSSHTSGMTGMVWCGFRRNLWRCRSKLHYFSATCKSPVYAVTHQLLSSCRIVWRLCSTPMNAICTACWIARMSSRKDWGKCLCLYFREVGWWRSCKVSIEKGGWRSCVCRGISRCLKIMITISLNIRIDRCCFCDDWVNTMPLSRVQDPLNALGQFFLLYYFLLILPPYKPLLSPPNTSPCHCLLPKF